LVDFDAVFNVGLLTRHSEMGLMSRLFLLARN
jgi:hypothetical protein